MARDRASRPEARAKRLFIAIDIPRSADDSLSLAIEPWRRRFPKAKWVPRENWHITVKFLGPTWPRLSGWVEQQVDEVAAQTKPFELRLTDLGAFPDASKAAVLWVGVDDAGGAVGRLAAALDEALSAEFQPEKSGFHPHLTIARSRPPLRLAEDFSQVSVTSEAFRVEEMTLYQSHLSRPAPRYLPLHRSRFSA